MHSDINSSTFWGVDFVHRFFKCLKTAFQNGSLILCQSRFTPKCSQIAQVRMHIQYKCLKTRFNNVNSSESAYFHSGQKRVNNKHLQSSFFIIFTHNRWFFLHFTPFSVPQEWVVFTHVMSKLC